ncbi:MAG TPA: hypothetical protein VFV38_18580 [Ktedonobacteraceae bacterium]|nr:hypothetical protein [Ktedonobacteraceae bacterium]
MMHTAPVLRLNPAQVTQLIGYCTAYRSFLWQHAMPTPERNQMIRSLQALQGRLERAQEQGQVEITLPITAEEKHTLQQLLSGLIQMYGSAFPSEQRNQALGEIAAWRLALQRMLSQT